MFYEHIGASLDSRKENRVTMFQRVTLAVLGKEGVVHAFSMSWARPAKIRLREPIFVHPPFSHRLANGADYSSRHVNCTLDVKTAQQWSAPLSVQLR